MAFCGNVLELVEKHKVLDDDIEFVQWTTFRDDPDVEVFIEKSILPELEQKDLIVIDVVIGDVNNKKIGLLFITFQVILSIMI